MEARVGIVQDLPPLQFKYAPFYWGNKIKLHNQIRRFFTLLVSVLVSATRSVFARATGQFRPGLVTG